jgi:Phage major capsid protein E
MAIKTGGIQGGAGGGDRTRAASTNWAMTHELYSITDMLEIMKVTYPSPMYFRDTLFQTTETCYGDTIACDFRRGDSVALPFCHPYKRGLARPRERFQTQWVTPPYIKSVTNIKALDLLKRIPNESAYSTQSPEERLAYWQTDDLMECDLGISRREEWACREILFNGRFDCVDGDDNRLLQTIDFGPPNTTVIPPASYWDLPGSVSDPIADLRLIKQAVTRAGYSGSIIIFGQDAATAFLNNQAVLDKMNFLNYRVAEVDARDESFGISRLGSFFGLPIVEYNAMYRDPLTNMMDFYMPPEMILVASAEVQNKMAYGEVVQTDSENSRMVSSFRASRVPSYITIDGEDQVSFRLQSRPVPIPVDILSWTVAQVCTRVSMPSAPIAPYTDAVGAYGMFAATAPANPLP